MLLQEREHLAMRELIWTLKASTGKAEPAMTLKVEQEPTLRANQTRKTHKVLDLEVRMVQAQTAKEAQMVQTAKEAQTAKVQLMNQSYLKEKT
mmetsp:Transcript_87343/g.189177  ORF Transcript_87343/g.189177 Transcript_87343/m.189177 type:complete len:93 (+) Transcript_87343:1286-1564(+)